MNNNQRNTLDDIIPAILTVVSAIVMGFSKRGSKLKNVAKDSVHCLLDNEQNQKPKHRNKRRDRRNRRKEIPTV
jgi:hypothetical protein